MNKTFSAYIEYHGKYTATLDLFERFKEKFDSLQGEGGFNFVAKIDEDDSDYTPMIWVRAHGTPESESIFEDLLKYVVNKMIHTPHEGIGKVYAKTVIIDPIDDDFFIPEILVTKYETDRDSIVQSSVETYISDEIV